MRDPQTPNPPISQLNHNPADLTQGIPHPPVPQARQASIPGVTYHDGVPYYAPQQYVVQLPGQQDTNTVSPWVRDLVVISVVLLVVLVVCCACVIAVVVMAGGTLMGIIGAASAAAVPVTIGLVATLLAFGWAAKNLRSLANGQKGKR